MDNSLKRYFEHGVLNENLNHHRRLAEVINDIAIGAGINPDMLYKYRLTDFIDEDHQVCTVVKSYPSLLKDGCSGIIISAPLNDPDKVLTALVGTLNRNKVDARYKTLRELTYELGSTERIIGTAFVVPDGDSVLQANKNRSNYNHSSVDEILAYCKRHEKMLILRCEDWEYNRGLLDDHSKAIVSKTYLWIK